MTAPRVALLTAAEYTAFDADMPVIVGALEDLGVEPSVVDWHSTDVDWGAFDLAVIRSTWDYWSQPSAFLERLAEAAARTTLLNPLPVVRANADKAYLLDLARAGVPVVPTTVLHPGDEVGLPDGDVVVKPTVSAGAMDTERHGSGPDGRDRARAHAAALLEGGRSVLVQPYVEALDERGETGLVYVGDAFSHAFAKAPILGPHAEPADGRPRGGVISPRVATDREHAVAEQVLDAVGALAPGAHRSDLLYARVDLAPGPDGPVLMELELIEPALYLHLDEAAPARVAAAIHVRLPTD